MWAQRAWPTHHLSIPRLAVSTWLQQCIIRVSWCCSSLQQPLRAFGAPSHDLPWLDVLGAFFWSAFCGPQSVKKCSLVVNIDRNQHLYSPSLLNTIFNVWIYHSLLDWSSKLTKWLSYAPRSHCGKCSQVWGERQKTGRKCARKLLWCVLVKLFSSQSNYFQRN